MKQHTMKTSRTTNYAILISLLVSSSDTAAFSTLSTVSFVPVGRLQQAAPKRNHLVLSVRKNDVDRGVTDGWKKISEGSVAVLAGIGLFAQVAFASPNSLDFMYETADVRQLQSSTVTSNVLLSVGAPSFGAGASFETLDFSLPSYSEAIGGDVMSKSKTSTSGNDEDIDAVKATEKESKEKADAAAKEEARRAAAEKKEAERAEKAAAEAKAKAEADTKAAKEAEKEARRAAEKEKQRLAVERQKAASEEAASSTKVSDVIDLNIPDTPSFSVPKIGIQKFDIPKIDIPSIEKIGTPSVPAVSAPAVDFKAPELPDIKLPSFSIPKVSAPVAEFKLPDMPSVNIKAPQAPDVKLPSFSIPKIPDFDAPKLDSPTFDIPSRSTAPAASFNTDIDSQEVRDSLAAAKKVDLKEAERVANEMEKSAKAAREKAKEAKKEFKQAKAEACVTRPGGKLLCLRGFGVGY